MLVPAKNQFQPNEQESRLHIDRHRSFLHKIDYAKKLYVFAYRNGRIPGKTAEELARLQTYVQQDNDILKFLVVNDNDKYLDYKGNEHHWTTKYCWTHVIPAIAFRFRLNFNIEDFKPVEFKWNGCDFSYHIPVCDMQFEVRDFVSNNNIRGNHDALRNINLCPKLNYSHSLYHMLFRLSHSCGMITNLNMGTGPKLAVNCDSMAIPIIPVLAPYFKKILVIDRRTENKTLEEYSNYIIDFKPTHYLEIFTDYNVFLSEKYYYNLFEKPNKVIMPLKKTAPRLAEP